MCGRMHAFRPNTLFRCTVAIAVAALAGCAFRGNQRDESFQHDTTPRRVTLVLVGGNSECSGTHGLWPVRDTIASDIARSLGLQRNEISTDYVTWTGDSSSSPGCLPGHPNYLQGQIKIARSLQARGALHVSSELIVVGWSNGGATAAQVSRYLSPAAYEATVDLLVTLDPVSFLTKRPDDARAGTWINVYTRSAWTKRLRTGNVIAAFGGAWNDFKMRVPHVSYCMPGNHGDVERMWRHVVVRSPAFHDWASKARARLGVPGRTPLGVPLQDDDLC